MSGVSVETVAIPVPNVAVQRPSRRGEPWRVSLSRFIFGRGSTLKAAKQELARQIAVATETVNVEPAFARDDDGSLIVAIDRPWGVEEYRLTDAGYKLIGTYDRDRRTPAEWLAATHHYTPVPPRR
ncbi:hypothetical protein [Streptomyces noursei]|uniref:hypothetical protein n=1 Tax=Streptomyces noursei TaxID=1971 RepID=UPI0023B7CED2|nr:hypothetical protein [Streptomyces noursei]